MALIECVECGREISSRATSCPHCGCPMTSVERSASTPLDEAPLAEVPVQPQSSGRQSSTVPEAAETPTRSGKTVIWMVLGIFALVVAIRACSGSDAAPETVQPTAISTQPATPPAPVVPKGPTEADKLRWAASLIDEETSTTARLSAANHLIKHFNQSPEGSKAKGMLKELEAALAYERMGRQWRYSSSEEGMSGKQIRKAQVSSTNTINLDFPYSGPQHATLALRRHPRWGNNVIFSIERGQILCASYGDCQVQVRFDDGRLLRYKGNPPSDNSSEYVFIPAFSTFVKRLPNTKTVKIEVQIYQGGSQVFEFDVSGFKPDKFK